MSLLTITQAVAKNVGLETPTAVLSHNDDDGLVKIVQFINETGQELARRYDWSALRKTRTIAGTGANANFELPSDFARFVQGMSVSVAGEPVRGSLSQDEWFSLTPVEGDPRFFIRFAETIAFYPFPASAQAVQLQYISSQWTSGGHEAFEDDAEEALIPERLLAAGAVYRFKRNLGDEFGDYMAEYEAMLTDLAKADGALRSP